MKITYIKLDGNIAITDEVVHVPANLIKIDNTYFEKKVEVKEVKKTKEVKEVKEPEVIVDAVEEKDVSEEALAFLKEQKVRGAHLLKGKKLIDKAVELGFNI